MSNYDQNADDEYNKLVAKDLENREKNISADGNEPAAPSTDAGDSTADSSYVPRHGLQTAEEDSEPSGGRERIQDVLGISADGVNYTGKHGDEKSKNRWSKLYGSHSKFKKRVALAGAAAGGSVVVAIVAFFALLPFKVQTIVNSLTDEAGAATSQAISIEGRNAFNTYMARYVLPGVLNGRCRTTADATCVGVISGTSPVDQMFQGFKDARLENKLAQKGILIGKQGSSLYLNIDGALGTTTNSALREVINDPANHSLFNLSGTQRADRATMQEVFDNLLTDDSKWKQSYLRFKVARLMNRKYGNHYCLIACNSKAVQAKNKVADSLIDSKYAAKAFFYRNTVGVFSEARGMIMECVVTGACDDKLAGAGPNDTENLSPNQQRVQARFKEYTAGFSDDELKDLVKKVNGISEDGVQGYLARQLATKIASSLGIDEAGAAAAGETAVKAIPVIGLVILAAQISHTSAQLGPTIQHMMYESDAAASVQLYGTYQTAAAEPQSGNSNIAALGSFSDALSTNMDGTTADQSDATQTPLYRALNASSDPSNAANFSSLFGGATYADGTTSSSYRCNDGKPVPVGALVCSEEVFNSGIAVANKISAIAQQIPILPQLGGVISTLFKYVGDITGPAFKGACDITFACKAATNLGSDAAGKIFSWLESLLPSPLSPHQSGGRTYDMLAAGANIAADQTCQVELGCMRATPEQAAANYDTYVATQKKAFQNQPMFARMFSLHTPYSLLSRLAVSMPGNLGGATSSTFSSVVSSPLQSLTHTFGSVFSSSRSFAAVPATDPVTSMGISRNYFPASEIPADPEAYWNQNCVNGPVANYDSATQKLDVSAWLNQQKQDSSTGEAYATSANPCLFLQGTSQVIGAKYNAKLIPSDGDSTASSDTSTPTSTGSTALPTGTAKELAQQIVNNPNITFQTGVDKQYFQEVVTAGTQSNCGGSAGVPISPKLLGTLLVAAQKYKIVVGVLDDGHSCDGGEHPKGLAADLNGVNSLDGTQGVGNSIDYSAMDANQKVFFTQFYNYMGSLLSSNGSGAEGQSDCMQKYGMTVTKAANVTYFPGDSCDHLHIDVR